MENVTICGYSKTNFWGQYLNYKLMHVKRDLGKVHDIIYNS